MTDAETNQKNEEKSSFFAIYISRMRAFSRNARLYLIVAMLNGIAAGIQALLFNFYILSLGYNEAVIGNIVTVRSATTLLAAIPMGYLTDRIGRRNAFILSILTVALASSVMLIVPSFAIFLSMNVLMGLAQSLSAVAMGPFLMENSTDLERTYLFSIASGLSMVSTSIGAMAGRILPSLDG